MILPFWLTDPDWLGAIGTIFATIVALFIAFLPSIRNHWNKPKIIIEYDNDTPFCVSKMIYKEEEPMEISYFIRLRIKNTGGTSARGCEAKISKIVDLARNDEDMFIDTHQLKWSYHTRGPVHLNSGEIEYVDFLEVFEDETRNIIIVGEPDYYKEPYKTRNSSVPRTDHLIEVKIYGENFKPVSASFKYINHENIHKVQLIRQG